MPSPTFTLVQAYETPRLRVSHYDLYRLKRESELEELGLDEALDQGAALIEWPERAERRLPADALIAALDADTERRVVLEGPARWKVSGTAPMSDPRAFLQQAGWGEAEVAPLQGDASTRRYARLRHGARLAMLMDQPQGAETPCAAPDASEADAPRPGLQRGGAAGGCRLPTALSAVAHYLRSARSVGAGNSMPPTTPHGLLVLEDLGDALFADGW